MACKQSTIDFLLQQIGSAVSIHAKKMFGEYGIYCDGKIVALVCDDQLFVKPTEAGLKFIGNIVESSPYPGARPYFLIPGEKWEDSTWLAQLVQISASELPLPKKKGLPQKKQPSSRDLSKSMSDLPFLELKNKRLLTEPD